MIGLDAARVPEIALTALKQLACGCDQHAERRLALVPPLGLDLPAQSRLSFAHPEVLLALSRRALFNNPTNIMFSCFKAAMIDCSDYAHRHVQDHGLVSLAHGYGPLYVDPRAGDFEQKLARALEDDALFDDRELGRKRDELLKRNPPDVEALAGLFRTPPLARQAA